MDIDQLYKEFKLSDGITIDSRNVSSNQIFFALPGEKTHGNEFALAAIEKGARLAIVTDYKLSTINDKCIVVQDTLLALQTLAKKHRENLKITIIGITGSVAKTTTKELVHAVLAQKFKTYCTIGNLNNHIGVPLTILAMNSTIEIGIVEMGANHIGEIDELCKIAQPDFGIITRIGKAHLEGFGSLEGVMIAKSDLYRYIRDHNGIVFINDSDPILQSIHLGFEMQKVFIHQTIKAEAIKTDPFLELKIEFDNDVYVFSTQIPGLYNLENIIAAICIGNYFKVPIKNIIAGISNYKPGGNRSELIQFGSNTFLLDAYNANPLSMSSAIESFAQIKSNSKGLIIGEMRELGSFSRESHQEIIRLIKSLKEQWEIVILVGKEFEELEKPTDWLWFLDSQALAVWYKSNIPNEFIFLIKASRGLKLEKIVGR